MIIAEALSEQEMIKHIAWLENVMLKRIAWLENEIDRCLDCGLPIQHLKSKLDEALYHFCRHYEIC